MSRALRRALQALGQPAPVQRDLFPEFASPADELARVLERALATADDEHSAEQNEALARIQAYFVQFAGVGHANFWDDLDDPRWETLRELAGRALDEYGWPRAKPGPHDP
jgi:hypothetical protein